MAMEAPYLGGKAASLERASGGGGGVEHGGELDGDAPVELGLEVGGSGRAGLEGGDVEVDEGLGAGG